MTFAKPSHSLSAPPCPARALSSPAKGLWILAERTALEPVPTPGSRPWQRGLRLARQQAIPDAPTQSDAPGQSAGPDFALFERWAQAEPSAAEPGEALPSGAEPPALAPREAD